MTHNYSSEQLREIAKRVLIQNPAYNELDSENNSLMLWLDLCCDLPGRDGALMRQLRHWIALNAPGVLDRMPVPDSFCRRAREVRAEMRQKGLLRPVL